MNIYFEWVGASGSKLTSVDGLSKPLLKSLASAFKNVSQVELFFLTSTTTTTPDKAIISCGIDSYNSSPLTGVPTDTLALLHSIPNYQAEWSFLNLNQITYLSLKSLNGYSSHRTKSKVLHRGSKIQPLPDFSGIVFYHALHWSLYCSHIGFLLFL